MSILPAVAEVQGRPAQDELPPEFLKMAWELYRLSQERTAGKTFVEVEDPIVEVCRQMGLWATTTSLGAHPLAEPEREHTCPRCGNRFRIIRASQPSRPHQSRLGRISYNRPYGTCDRCKLSGAPMDWELGLSSDVAVTPGMLKRICHAAVVGRSFEDAAEIITVHGLGAEISAKQVRVLAEREGHRLAQQRDRVAAAYRQGQFEIEAEQSPRLLVVCADGGRVQTREGFEERGAKQRRELSRAHAERDEIDPARQSKRHERWKEDKVGVVYDAVAKPQLEAAYGKYKGAKAKIKTYVATMQPWESFGWMLRVEAEVRGYLKAKTRLFLADGAKHIREMKNLHFQETIFILDWAHAAGHVAACAKALFGEGTDKTRGWYKEHRDMLWDGKRDELIAELQDHSRRLGVPEEGEADSSPRKVLHQNAHSYFPNNRDAVDYPTFRAEGWPIGSGVAEGAVKQFAKRMKGSEKFWHLGNLDNDLEVSEIDRSQTGAEEMLALCALYYSKDGRWQRHWEKRGQPIRWK